MKIVKLLHISLALIGTIALAQERPQGEIPKGEHQIFAQQYAASAQEILDQPAGPGYSIIPLQQSAAPTGLTKEVFGYLPYWFRNNWSLLDYRLISTIAYFSAQANSDGTVGTTNGWPRYAGDPSANASVISMINAAHQNGVRVVLCFTNFGATSIDSLVSNAAFRNTFIQQALALVLAGGGDGININFEGLLSSSRDGLTQFMKELADSFHVNIPGSQVSCAPTDYDTRSGDWDIAAINPWIDLFFFQGYGYGWSGSTTTRPVGLLPNTPFWGSLNITTLIDFVLARIPPAKVVLGVPHYGRLWPAASPDPKAATTGTGTAFYYPDALGYTASYGRLWDALSLNPWFRYQVSGAWYQGWYDDPESMAHKYQFVLDRNLAGVGMWALGMDGSNHDIWDVLAQYFGDTTVVIPPHQPVLSLVKDTSDVAVGKAIIRWTTTYQPSLGGFRLYVGISATSPPSMLLYDESTLGPSSRSVLVSGLSKNTAYYFRLVAVDTKGEAVSDPSDTYGVLVGQAVRYLVVDGFSRTTGSYSAPYHSFNTSYAEPLASLGRWFDSADNDALATGTVSPSGYAGLIWFVGDNSVTDRSLNPADQNIIKGYLESGGRLFITGSEIGYDLDRTGSSNKNSAWYNEYLRALYQGDAASGSSFTGSPGGIFAGVSGQFGQTYPEDYPDYIAPTGGSSRCLDYNSTQYAGIQYAGTFGSGSVQGRLVYVGFAVETIASLSQRQALLEHTLRWFEGALSADRVEARPSLFCLSQNYPNPFNPSTTIEFSVPSSEQVAVVVYDVLGREVARLVDGPLEGGVHRVIFDGTSLPSGSYYCTLRTPDQSQTRRMMLVR
jgi:spore germination protein YaaH